jgi:polyphosphate:AMP phosphotransferase
MFESAEVGNTVDKQTYAAESAGVRAALIEAQRELAGAGFAVVVLVAGVEGGGKSEVINLLLAWLDARGVQTHALDRPTEEERQRPPMWRFWRRLAPHGSTAVFFGSWDSEVILDCVRGRLSRQELERRLGRMVQFERMLHAENTLLVKFWLHLSRKEQKRRLRKLEADPVQSWRVSRREWKTYKHYDELRELSEQVLRRTSTAEAPWAIVEAADKRYRNLTVARGLLAALRERLERAKAAPPRPAPQPVRLQPPERNVLNQLDLTLSLGPKEYKKRLAEAQAGLNLLVRRLRAARRSLILVFEGPDAAGKGGAIRRLTEALDARDYRVIATSAPTDEERAHPYLWRFWRHLPGQGRVTLYDRSWYGRVLVERVEGFATPEEWQRAYEEINAFEEQLTDFGTVVLKFWLAVSPEEQLRRFQDREETPYKQYKITAEDWRNRDRWESYEAAACAMIEKTSSTTAPWVLVEADNKEWARVKVLEAVNARLQEALAE